MSTLSDVHDVIKGLLGQKNIITVPRLLVRFMDDSLESGVFLNQLIFWSDKGDETGWFYKSRKEWQEDTCLSDYAIRKATQVCIKKGFLETDVRRANGDPTVHYLVDTEKFIKLLIEFSQNVSLKSTEPNVEINKSLTVNKDTVIKPLDADASGKVRKTNVKETTALPEEQSEVVDKPKRTRKVKDKSVGAAPTEPPDPRREWPETQRFYAITKKWPNNNQYDMVRDAIQDYDRSHSDDELLKELWNKWYVMGAYSVHAITWLVEWRSGGKGNKGKSNGLDQSNIGEIKYG